jgi:hypothetical protein
LQFGEAQLPESDQTSKPSQLNLLSLHPIAIIKNNENLAVS